MTKLDRTKLRAYDLPRQMSADELFAAMDARGAKGLGKIQVTARSYKSTLACLGLTDKQLQNVKGQRILICGEGASDFGKTLQKRGAFVVAIDKLYTVPKSEMADKHLVHDWGKRDVATLVTPTEVHKRLPKHLVGGDAAQLPFASGSFDAVFIPNVVYWYLDADWSTSLGRDQKAVIKTGEAIIDEALRVSRGYVHFDLGRDETVIKQLGILSKRYKGIDVSVMPNANIRLTRPQKQTREPDVQKRKR